LTEQCQGNILVPWEYGHIYIPTGGNDSAEILAFFVQFECVILHTNVEFHEKLVSDALTKDIHDYGKMMLLLLDHFIELSLITNPMYTSIFLWGDEGGTCPFTFLLCFEDPLT